MGSKSRHSGAVGLFIPRCPAPTSPDPTTSSIDLIIVSKALRATYPRIHHKPDNTARSFAPNPTALRTTYPRSLQPFRPPQTRFLPPPPYPGIYVTLSKPQNQPPPPDMKFLLLLATFVVMGSAAPAPAPGANLLNLPKELQGVDLAMLATCGGGTGFCSGGRCICSGFCEGICEWYECGGC